MGDFLKSEVGDRLTDIEIGHFMWRPDFELERDKSITAIRDARMKAENIFNSVRSPLVLDLDGDGVETRSIDRGVYFDHDGNGFAEGTGWVGSDDGLLVYDRNGNGEVDDGGELFGSYTVLQSGLKAANGFVALSEFDNNHDTKNTPAGYPPVCPAARPANPARCVQRHPVASDCGDVCLRWF